ETPRCATLAPQPRGRGVDERLVPHPRRSRFALALVLLAAASCGHRRTATTDGTVEIPAGPFWTGSSLDDRAQALDARRREGPTSPMAVAWLREEAPLRRVEQSAFRIMVRPVTQYDYWTYTQATGDRKSVVEGKRADTGGRLRR